IHSDSDEGDGSIKYTISGEGAGTIFIIDEITGDIHATERLDREEKTFYTLRAQARDRLTDRPLEPESEFIIKVQDINDSEPKFLEGPYIGSVPELSPIGTSVMKVTASDADDPTYGSSARVVYSVLDGEKIFSVDSKTDCDASLYEEVSPVFCLECLEANFHLCPRVRVSLLIWKSCSGLMWSMPFMILKTWIKSPRSLLCSRVKRFSSLSLSVGHSLQTWNKSGSAMTSHSLNPSPGVIRTAVADLDRETQDRYELVVKATDMAGQMGGLSGSTTVTIVITDVNDNPPRFPQSDLSNFERGMVVGARRAGLSISQSAQLLGFSRTTISRVYKEWCEKGKTSSMRQSCGRKCLVDARGQRRMGRLIQADRRATLTEITTRYNREMYQFSVSEGAAVGTPVGRVMAEDADMGENTDMSYLIKDEEGGELFRVSTDGETQEAVITVRKPLDFENKRTHNVVVEAINKHVDPRFVDLGSFRDQTIVRVSVTDIDEPPLFRPPVGAVMDVQEDARLGALVGVVTAMDPDQENAPVRYSIDRGTDQEKIFNIDPVTGAITLGKILDRETAGWHNITVTAVEADNPAQATKTSISIRILDVNDNPPELATPYEASICEDAKPGQLIHTISVVDRDEPQTGHRFYFTLAPEAANNRHFTLWDVKDNTAGIRTQRTGFNRREQNVYLLPILVVDSGPPALSSTGTLTIRVCGCDTEGTIQSCNATAYVMSAALSPGALIALLVCMLILIALLLKPYFNKTHNLSTFSWICFCRHYLVLDHMRLHFLVKSGNVLHFFDRLFVGYHALRVLVLLILTLKRHRKGQRMSEDEEDMRDNVIKYNDEGGGEQDTQAYDMSALRSLYDFPEVKGADSGPDLHSLPQWVQSHVGGGDGLADFSMFRGYIRKKVEQADADLSVPPYDSFQTYAFEGSSSPALSLSSINTLSTTSEQDFSYLSNWGPRFRQLASLYAAGHPEEEGS
ncbi:CAD22 protein, partial [Amia calva]|nr:CAD22 protein [Amia calva]